MNKQQKSEHDRRLIEKAKRDWTCVSEEDALTEEGRREVHRICVRGYHNEEYSAGLL